MDNKKFKDIRNLLADLYGMRLKKVLLYGSRARGDFNEGSDIDILVLLEGPVDFGAEVKSIVDALYDLQLETGVIIEALPVDVESFERNSWPLYKIAREEGVRI